MHRTISSLARLALGLGLVGALGTAPAAAQAARSAEPRPAKPRTTPPPDSPAATRQGMWVGAGLGAGSGSLHCRICEGDLGTRGTSGYVRVGTTVNTYFLVGAEIDGWMRSDEGGRQRVLALTGNAYWYPDPRHGYYVKGGFGFSNYRQSADDDNDVTTAVTAGAFTGQLGMGYEIRMNPRMSIAPFVNLIGSAKGQISTERDDGTHLDRDRLDTRGNVILLQLGLGVTWH